MANLGRIKRHSLALAVIGAQLVWTFQLPAAAEAAANSTSGQPFVQVTSVGGFVAPAWQASRLPQLQIASDGTAVVENPSPKHGYVREGFALKLSLASAKSFAGKLVKALETPAGGWGMPPVADMPNTRFVVNNAGKKLDVMVQAFSYQGSGLTPAQTSARKALSKLLTSMESTVTRAKRHLTPAKYEIWGLSPIVDNGGVGIANPAAVYCQSIGGSSNIVETAAGQAGYCQLPSGENLDEWVNYRQALATLPRWPSGLAVPVNDPNASIMSCSAVAASKVANQLANRDDGGRWLLPSGQALPVVLRPVLIGETACHRSW